MAADRAPLRYVWASLGVFAAGVAWYAAHVTIGAGARSLAYTFLPLGGVVAAAAVAQLLRTVPLDPVARRFWRGLFVAFLLLFAGYTWLAVELLATPGPDSEHMPMGAAALVAAGFGVAIWAVALVPIGAGPVGRWRVALDRTIAFLGCATVLWHFGLAPMISAPQRWSSQATVLVGLAFMLAIGGITKVSHVRGGPVDRLAIRLVAATGLTAAAVALCAVHLGYAGGIPSQAVIMPIAPVLAALAVWVQWRRAVGPGVRSRRRVTMVLPYIAVAAVDVPLIAVAFGIVSWPVRLVIAAAVAVTTLVGIRQYVAFRDNARLLAQQRIQEARLQHEATHDGLTGLPNRALFRERAAAALVRHPITVLLIDLDDFKTVNDSLGHAVGDRLLGSVADALRTAAGPDALPVRLGGDEFAVLLVDPDNAAPASGSDSACGSASA